MKRIALAIIVVAFAVYAGDAALAKWRGHFETVHIERFLAVREKFNKISYEPTDPIDQRCVSAVFPHQGANPCWYVKRHRVQMIEVN